VPSERILIADDDSGMRDIIAILCARKGYATDTVADGEQAVAALEAQPYALFVLDLVMPGRSAVKVMASARSRQPDCEVILLRGYADERSATEALRLGAYDYVEKPLDLAHASVVIERALERRRMKIRNAALLRDLQEARGEIERRRRQELEAIRQIGQALASALEGREIVEVLVQAVYNAIRCDVAAALLAGP